MRIKLALAFILLFATTASAQERSGHGIGLGVQQTLGGISGLSLTYDADKFHIDVVLGFANIDVDPGDDVTLIGLAGRFFYHVHQMDNADFGLGGGLGIVSLDAGDAESTSVQIEVGMKLRVFLAPNVTLSTQAGLILLTADDDVDFGGINTNGDRLFGVTGTLAAGFGLTYFFR
jgi:hypothetical protein